MPGTGSESPTIEKVAQLLRLNNEAFIICYYCMLPVANNQEFSNHMETECEELKEYEPSSLKAKEKFRTRVWEHSVRLTDKLANQLKTTLQPPVEQIGERHHKTKATLRLRKSGTWTSSRKGRSVSARIKACQHLCPFCEKGLNSISQFYAHGMSCKGIRKLEPSRKCSYCQQEMPVTKSYIHEISCSKFLRVNLPRQGQIKIKYKCPICKDTSINYGNKYTVAYHLATECLPQVKRYLETGKVEANPEPPAKKRIKVEPDSSDENEQSPTLMEDIGLDNNPDIKVDPLDLVENTSDDNEPLNLTEDIKEEQNEVERTEEVVSSENETGSEIQIKSTRTVILCPFCQENFASHEELKSKHLLSCNGIKMFEPKTNCRHCNLRLPFSLHGIHGMICKKNTNRFILSPDNLKYSDVLCPECQDVFKAKDLPRHLATCLQHLEKILSKTLDCSNSCSWMQNGIEDYVKEAGLNDWFSR